MVLILLLLVLITNSLSQDLQYVPIANSLSSLRPSSIDDYFYFRVNDYYIYGYLYLFLLGESYNLKDVQYCYSNSHSESDLKYCSFYSVDNYDYDTQISSSSKGYYYRIQLSSNRYYLIIKYSGSYRFSYSNLKVKGTYKSFIEYSNVNDKSDKKLSSFQDINNYFFVSIDGPNSGYLYLYFDDPNSTLKEPIYYCITENSPELSITTIKDCSFSSAYYYEKKPSNNYDYSYRVNVKSNKRDYIVIKYLVSNTYDNLYVKSLYEPTKLSTLAIVFIVIAGVVFVSVIIIIICYCCKKRNSNNINYVQTQPAVVIPEQPALVVQTPSYPLMEQNNMYPSY